MLDAGASDFVFPRGSVGTRTKEPPLDGITASYRIMIVEDK